MANALIYPRDRRLPARLDFVPISNFPSTLNASLYVEFFGVRRLYKVVQVILFLAYYFFFKPFFLPGGEYNHTVSIGIHYL